MTAPTHALDLEFGSSQYASSADSSSLSVTGDISILARVKFESLPGTTGQNAGIVCKANSDTQLDYDFRIRDSGGTPEMSFFYSDAGSIFDISNRTWTTSAITAGNWHNIAVMVDVSARTVDFYVDSAVNSGTADGSNTSISDSGYSTVVGNDLGGAGRYFDGLIKDVMIISDYLSEAQVDSIFTNICTFTPNANTRAWWEFNNNFNDSSGNGNTLTGSGSPTFSTDIPYVCAAAGGANFLSLLGAGA